MLTFVRPTSRILNQPARHLTREELATTETQQLIDDMLAFANGQTRPSGGQHMRLVGLAAPQVGHDVAIALVDNAMPEKWSGNLMELVNPVIESTDGEKLRWWHGCFSTGPICGTLRLPSRIKVQAWNRHGEEIELLFEGRFPSHVAWHEIQHLEGKRFPDETLAQEGEELLIILPHELSSFRMGEPWHRPAKPAVWKAMKNGIPWQHLL